MSQAPQAPASASAYGRVAACEKPRQFQPYWREFLTRLPTQVRKPLNDALNARLSLPRRRAALYHARRHFQPYKSGMATYAQSVEAMMEQRGMEYVDPSDPMQADAFLKRLTPSGLRALGKRQRAGVAIAFAEMTIEWLDMELAHGD
jgi:hypothetical protein